MGETVLGIEIGGTKLQLVAGEATGHIQHRWRVSVEPARGGEGIRQEIARLIPEIRRTAAPCVAVGVGFGGPVNYQTGVIACSHQIEGWSAFPVRDWLESLVNAPVRVDNDANVASLGEALGGAGGGHNPVFYATLGSGVGGGLVVDGKIYHGAVPGEAELGHLRLDRAGAIVENRCSGWAVDRKIRAAIRAHRESPLARLVGGATRNEAQFLRPACEQGDPVANRLLRETAEDLALGLSHVVHLFHPRVIVIGGGLALVGELLRQAVAEALPRFVMSAFAQGTEIKLARLGEDAVPCGALLLAGTRERG